MYLYYTSNVIINQPVPTSIATYPVRKLSFPGKSALIIFLVSFATDPFSNKLSSLTMKINDVMISTSEITNNKIPTVSSDRSVLANKFSPESK